MEIPKLKPLQIVLLVGVHLALLNGVNVNSNSGVKTESTSLEKYLSKSYFDKHDSLLDPSFDNYIANELPVGLCGTLRDNLDTKQLVHKRHLTGEGPHCKLHSTIKIKIQPDRKAEELGKLWTFVIEERLPTGVFADPFELQHLIGRGVFIDATVLGDTNLELPSVASNRCIVGVHVERSRDILSTNDYGLKIDIQLPLHTRYPPLGESGFSRVEFGSPGVFIFSNIEGISPNRNCILALKLNAKTKTLVWEVPSGNREHSGYVSVVTFVSAVLSAIFIIVTTLQFPYL